MGRLSACCIWFAMLACAVWRQPIYIPVAMLSSTDASEALFNRGVTMDWAVLVAVVVRTRTIPFTAAMPFVGNSYHIPGTCRAWPSSACDSG